MESGVRDSCDDVWELLPVERTREPRLVIHAHHVAVDPVVHEEAARMAGLVVEHLEERDHFLEILRRALGVHLGIDERVLVVDAPLQAGRAAGAIGAVAQDERREG